jgi:transposase
MEDLNVSGMMQNHKLVKSIQELSLYEFRRILDYKCDWYGRELVFVDRYFASSKLCNICLYKNNSLLNILNEGLRIISTRSAEFTLVERRSLEHSLKQEELNLGEVGITNFL